MAQPAYRRYPDPTTHQQAESQRFKPYSLTWTRLAMAACPLLFFASIILACRWMTIHETALIARQRQFITRLEKEVTGYRALLDSKLTAALVVPEPVTRPVVGVKRRSPRALAEAP